MFKIIIRTDMAVEFETRCKKTVSGIEKTEENVGKVKLIHIDITSSQAAKELSKTQGKYITAEFEDLLLISDYTEIKKAIIKALKLLLPDKNQKILVVGLGNREITADSVGPFVCKRILATRHLTSGISEQIGLKGLKSVSVITPDVMAKTGIESLELIKGICEKIMPDAVIAVDALAAAGVKRLYRNIQLSNTGISPGSGVKNSRKELSKKSLGIPVIAVGVPTVTDVAALAFELTKKEPSEMSDMIVTPKDADFLTEKISEIIAEALNIFLQPEIEPEVILSLI